MKQLFILLTLVCGSLGFLESGLRVRYRAGANHDSDYFVPIARTASEARSEGWTVTPRPPSRLPSLVMYCAPDRMMCALYDSEEIVAGVQIAIAQEDISGSTLDWETQGFVEWTATTEDGETLKYWAIQQYFVSPETLDMPEKDRVKVTKSNELLREGAVWLTGYNGQLMKMPQKIEGLHGTLFTRQACYPWMGEDIVI